MKPGQRCTLAVSAAHDTGHVFKPEFERAWEQNRFLAWETRCPHIEPAAPPVDPVEAILAVECPEHSSDVGDACWHTDGEDGDQMFCADRIRRAALTKGGAR